MTKQAPEQSPAKASTKALTKASTEASPDTSDAADDMSTNAASDMSDDTAERTPFALNLREQPAVVHPAGVLLRVATPEDDPTIAQFYFDMWADYAMTELLSEQWLEQTLAFIAHAREHLDYSAFIAETPPADTLIANHLTNNANRPEPHQASELSDSELSDSELRDSAHVLGVAACQRFAGLYPWIFSPEKRTHGYIWGVRVVPEARRRGIARLLVSACRDYLRELGCQRVRLHAATQGKALYEKMGFTLANEMVLELDQPPPSDNG